jgi:hypothetical protein
MPDQDLAALLAVWQLFQPYLTRPAFARMLPIAAGWILTTAAKRAITETLVVTGIAGKRHHEAYHRFFSRGTWSPDHIGLELLWHLHKRGMPLMLVLDDTVAPKKGPSVHGIGSHVDPVRSTKAFRVFTFGHCWVVLCMVIHVPFSQRPWALPVLFRLYRNKKDCAAKGAAYHKKTELGRVLWHRVFPTSESRWPLTALTPTARCSLASPSTWSSLVPCVPTPCSLTFQNHEHARPRVGP